MVWLREFSLLLQTYLPSKKMFSCIWDAIVQWCLVWSFATNEFHFCAYILFQYGNSDVHYGDRKLLGVVQRNFLLLLLYVSNIETDINQWFKFLSRKESFSMFLSEIRKIELVKVFLAKKRKEKVEVNCVLQHEDWIAQIKFCSGSADSDQILYDLIAR